MLPQALLGRFFDAGVTVEVLVIALRCQGLRHLFRMMVAYILGL